MTTPTLDGAARSALRHLAAHDHPTFGMTAITEALLALAEEQRTANLIAWFALVDGAGDMPDEARELSGLIVDRLGLRSDS